MIQTTYADNIFTTALKSKVIRLLTKRGGKNESTKIQ